jgi:putative colanic acid biosynthesis glycosyltransferase WcaI
MKLLIVNIYFHPDPTGTGLVITELARDLVCQGHEVTVITSVPHYGGHRPGTHGEREDVRSGSARIKRWAARWTLWQESTLDGIRVIRTAVFMPRKNRLWSRALNYLSFSLLAIVAGARTGRHDVILCASPPLSIGVSAWLLSRLLKAPFVFNVQDIYPDAAVLMGVLRRPALIRLLQRLERFIYERATRVVVISDGARRNLRDKGVPDGKLVVIPNWADVEFVTPFESENPFRRGLGLDGRPIVMFAGNIGLIAGLDTVLAAAAILRRTHIHFLIVGDGNAKEALVSQARDMGLSNVTFLKTQPRSILPQVLSAADVHLVTLKRQMSTTSLPSKSYGIMASARPMVAAVDPGSEVWRLVEKAESGLCVPPEDPEALAQAIASLCNDPARSRRLGENARRYVVRHYAKHDLTACYGDLLQTVAATGSIPLSTQALEGPGLFPSGGPASGRGHALGTRTRSLLARTAHPEEGKSE